MSIPAFNAARSNTSVRCALAMQEEQEKTYFELSGMKRDLSSITYGYTENTSCMFREEQGAMFKTVPLRYPQTYETAQEYFVRCIVEDKQPDPGADDGVEMMRLIDAIYESARIGREVEVRHVNLSKPVLPGCKAVAD